MNKEELIHAINMHAKPINFDQFIEEGYLEKTKNKTIYKLLKKLPEYASCKIKTLKQTEEGLFVSFGSHKQAEKLQKRIRA